MALAAELITFIGAIFELEVTSIYSTVVDSVSPSDYISGKVMSYL